MRQLFLPYRYYILLPVKNKVKFLTKHTSRQGLSLALRHHNLDRPAQFLHHNLLMVAAEFPIQRPRNRILRCEPHLAGLKRVDHVRIVHKIDQRCDDLV